MMNRKMAGHRNKMGSLEAATNGLGRVKNLNCDLGSIEEKE